MPTQMSISSFDLTAQDGVLHSIPIEPDYYVNGTKLCRAGGKEYKHWKERKESTAEIEACVRSVGIPTCVLIRQVKTGPLSGRGTFVHRRLAILIAQWVSAHFAVQVAGIIEDIIFGVKVLVTPTITSPTIELQPELLNISGADPMSLFSREYVATLNFLDYDHCHVFYIGYIGCFNGIYHFKFGRSDGFLDRGAHHVNTYGKFELVFISESLPVIENLFKDYVKNQEIRVKLSYKTQMRTELFIVDDDNSLEQTINYLKMLITNTHSSAAMVKSLTIENEQLKIAAKHNQEIYILEQRATQAQTDSLLKDIKNLQIQHELDDLKRQLQLDSKEALLSKQSKLLHKLRVRPITSNLASNSPPEPIISSPVSNPSQDPIIRFLNTPAPSMTGTKLCCVCAAIKPTLSFSFRNVEKNIRHSSCKACDRNSRDITRKRLQMSR